MINTELFPVVNNLDDIRITDNSLKTKDYIVAHHSATTQGSAEAYHRYHVQEKHWLALGYHFVIGNGSPIPDGLIQCNLARDFDHDWDFTEEVGAHAAGFNTRSIGICVTGSFDGNFPSFNQIIAFTALVGFLRRKLGILVEHLIGHREVGEHGGATVYKSCPGTNIDLDVMRSFVEVRNRENLEADIAWYHKLVEGYAGKVYLLPKK